MSLLQAIINYFCRNYPYPNELSKARLTKLVYLADWKAAQQSGRQLTEIEWVFNHYGPYVEDVVDAATATAGLEVVHSTNIYGAPKVVVRAVGDIQAAMLPREVAKILDEVIEDTSPLSFSSFIKYVYDTFPIRTADRYDNLNLAYLASQESGNRQ